MRNRLPVGPHGQGSDGTHIFERDLQTQDHLNRLSLQTIITPSRSKVFSDCW